MDWKRIPWWHSSPCFLRTQREPCMQDLAEKSNQYFHTFSALASSTWVIKEAVRAPQSRASRPAALRREAELAISAVRR